MWVLSTREPRGQTTRRSGAFGATNTSSLLAQGKSLLGHFPHSSPARPPQSADPSSSLVVSKSLRKTRDSKSAQLWESDNPTHDDRTTSQDLARLFPLEALVLLFTLKHCRHLFGVTRARLLDVPEIDGKAL
jgi:hypothetical protein